MKKEENLVSITKNTFSPPTMSVKEGETVTWVNNDTMDHNITSDDNSFVSPIMKAGTKYSYTFTKAGTYDYTCTLYEGMKGKIVVTK
jgi:amicyanin